MRVGRHLILTLVAVVLATVVAACGTEKIDRADAESFVREKLEARSGPPVGSVECPDDVEVEANATFECTAVSENGDLTATVTVKQRDDEGNVEITGIEFGGEDGAETGEGGEIAVEYEEPRNRTEALAQTILRVGGTEGVAKGFTTSFVLPTDITVSIRRGDVSPFYDPRTRTITWTYGFVDQIARILQEAGVVRSKRDLGTQLASITSFITVHELGHAFVDVFEIPITGREEDAVDGLATVFLTDAVKGGAEYAFYAARFFALLQEVQGKPTPVQFQDEHSLSIQRFYDIVCAVAGSSRENLSQVAQLGILGSDRLQRCPAEYEQKSQAWKTLLEPHVRG